MQSSGIIAELRILGEGDRTGGLGLRKEGNGGFVGGLDMDFSRGPDREGESEKISRRPKNISR